MTVDLVWVANVLKESASIATSVSVVLVPIYVYTRKKLKIFQTINDTVQTNSGKIEKIFEAVAESKKDREETREIVQTIKDGMVESLKSQLVEMCVPIIKKNGITTDELEKLNHLWKPYEKMGGNSTGERLYLQATSVPLIDD